MSISSRTPEGTPSHCPVCGALTPIDFSADTGDAACPACGCLLWKSAAAFDALRQWLEDQTEVETAGVTGTTHLREMDIDSLTLVELVMEVEEAYDISIPDDQADKIRTVGDVVRFILENIGQE